MQVAYKNDLCHRLHRITGQVEGITRMVEEDRTCVDILTQIRAVRAALSQVALLNMENHIQECVGRSVQTCNQGEAVDELMDVLQKYVK